MEYTARELLGQLYHAAIDAVDGRFVVQQWLTQHADCRPQYAIAIGKAAGAMLQGTLDLRPAVQAALLISPERRLPRSLLRDKRITTLLSAHPVPDQRSLQAGEALLDFVRRTADEAQLLFLISGGSSSLVEVLREGVTLQQLQQLNRQLLASGKAIDEINRARARLSAIKAGGLLQHLGSRALTQLLISDVPANDPQIIGSGLLAGCEHSHVVATLQQAMQAAVAEAEQYDLAVQLHDDFIEGDAVQQGRAIARRLLAAEPGIHVFGGETTVSLPDKPGIGGRNQSLALSLARTIEGEDICVLCAGTDGIDGVTPCAGALVTGDTAARARQMGFDIDTELAAANAGTVLMATDDLFKPGPTQTNVMDLVLAYKRGNGSARSMP